MEGGVVDGTDSDALEDAVENCGPGRLMWDADVDGESRPAQPPEGAPEQAAVGTTDEDAWGDDWEEEDAEDEAEEEEGELSTADHFGFAVRCAIPVRDPRV